MKKIFLSFFVFISFLNSSTCFFPSGGEPGYDSSCDSVYIPAVSQYSQDFEGFVTNSCSSLSGSACVTYQNYTNKELSMCVDVGSNSYCFFGILDSTKEAIDTDGDGELDTLVPKCGENEQRGDDSECHSVIPEGCNAAFPLDSPTGDNCVSSWIQVPGSLSGKTCYNCDSNSTTSPDNPPSNDQCDQLNATYTDYCTQNGGTLISFDCTQFPGEEANFDFNCNYPSPPENNHSEVNTTVVTVDSNGTESNTTTSTTIVKNPDGSTTETTVINHPDGSTTSSTTIISGGSSTNNYNFDTTNLENLLKNNTDQIHGSLTGTMPYDSSDTSEIDNFINGVTNVDTSNAGSIVQGQFNSIYAGFSSDVISSMTGWLDNYNVDVVNPFEYLNQYYLTHQFKTLTIDLSATNVELLSNAPSIEFTEELLINKLQPLYNITTVIFIFLGVISGFVIFVRTVSGD